MTFWKVALRGQGSSSVLLPVLCLCLLIAALASPVTAVDVLDLVSMTTTDRATSFMKGLKAALKDSSNKLNGGEEVTLKEPSNKDDLVASVTAEAANNEVPFALGPATDEGLLTLLNSNVSATNHFSYFSPLTASDLGADYTPYTFFLQNPPLIQLMALITHLKSVKKGGKVSVMYVKTPSSVSDKIGLGTEEVKLLQQHLTKKIHVLGVADTDTAVSDLDFNNFVNYNPDSILIFDRLGSSPVSLDFYARLVTNSAVIGRATPIYAPYASAVPFMSQYQTSAATSAVVDPSHLLFSTSMPVLLDTQYDFLSEFEKSMANSDIDASATGTAENAALIEGWIAGKVMMTMLNAFYAAGMTRETFFQDNLNQNRYTIGNNFAIGPYFGVCTALMIEQGFLCESTQGARTLFVNQGVASPTAAGKDTLTPATTGTPGMYFPPSYGSVNSGLAYSNTWTSGDSSSSFPWWAILLIVLGCLLLLLVLLLLLWWCCCSFACCACCGADSGFAVTDTSKPLTVTILDIYHGDILWANIPKEMQRAVRTYQKITRDLIKDYKCYEARASPSGEFMIVSQTPDQVVRLAHLLQTRLQEQQWETSEIERVYNEIDRRERSGEKWESHNLRLLSPSTSPSSSPERDLPHTGPRVGIGIHTGYVDSIQYDKEIEGYVYQGYTVLMAEQAQCYTQGSRILVTEYAFETLQKETRREYDFQRTSLNVHTEDHQLMPLYEERTPITNYQDMTLGLHPIEFARDAGAVANEPRLTATEKGEHVEPRHASVAPMSAAEKEERRVEEHVEHRYEKAPRVTAVERADPVHAPPTEEKPDFFSAPSEPARRLTSMENVGHLVEPKEHLEVKVVKTAHLALMRATEEEPYIPSPLHDKEERIAQHHVDDNRVFVDPDDPYAAPHHHVDPLHASETVAPIERRMIPRLTTTESESRLSPPPVPEFQRWLDVPTSVSQEPTQGHQYMTRVPLPDRLHAHSEELSKSKSRTPEPVEGDRQVIEPPFYQRRNTAHNDRGVQTHLSSLDEPPSPQPRRTPQQSARGKKSTPRPKEPVISFQNGRPSVEGDVVIPCFSEGNGLLFRIIDSKTDTWSYYNDTEEFVMIATLSIGRRSDFQVLDNFRTVWNPKLRKYEGEVVIHPLQTVRVLQGTINGYSIAYAARMAYPSEQDHSAQQY